MSNRKVKAEETWKMMARYGDGTQPSVRQVAKEFGVAESSLRGVMDASARRGLVWPRNFMLHRMDVLAARLEQCVHELAELRRELAEQDTE